MIRSYSVVFFFIILYVVILCLFPGCALFSFDCSPDYQFLDDELSYQESRNAVDAFCLIVESNSKEKHESFDSLGYDVTFEDAKMYAMASASIGDFVNESRMLGYLNYPFDDELLKKADNYTKAKSLVRDGRYMDAFRLFRKYPDYLESSVLCDEMIRQEFVTVEVGDIGLAGGYVFYDKGFYSDGWRYLEAAPADLRLVADKPTVDSTMEGYSDGKNWFIFGFYKETDGGSYVCLDTEYGIGEGRRNTRLLVGAMGSSSYTKRYHTGTTSEYAARLCDELEYEMNGEVFKDWFLPSKDELMLMYENLLMKGLGSFGSNTYYWSSSENYAYGAWTLCSNSYGDWYDCERGDGCLVRPVRAF